MARTTRAKVQQVLGRNYDNSTDLDQFIEIATDIVSEVSSCATDRSDTQTTTTLELLERLLAAHLYEAADPGYTRKRTERAEGYFQGSQGMGLMSTRYGERALMLDYSGCLASITAEKVQLTWLGLPPSDQTDVWDRD